MGYQMAGLLSGIGQGLVSAGQMLEQRRREALVLAQQEANRRAEQVEWDRRNELTTAARRADRADEHRNRLAIVDRQGDISMSRDQARFNQQDQNREDNQRHALTIEERRRRSAADLARLRSSLAGANNERSARLEAELGAANVHGIVYGPADQQGNAEVIIVNRNGQLRGTGRRVRPPGSRGQERGDSLGSLD